MRAVGLALSLLIASSLVVERSAGAGQRSGRAVRPSRSAGLPAGSLKVRKVVDHVVDGFVVRRTVHVTNRPASVPEEKPLGPHERAGSPPKNLTLKGRLEEATFSESVDADGFVHGEIVLVRPGAHHLSGPEATVVYEHGRVQRRPGAPSRSSGRPAAGRAQRGREPDRRRPPITREVEFWQSGTDSDWVRGDAHLSTHTGDRNTLYVVFPGHAGQQVWSVRRDLLGRALRSTGSEFSRDLVTARADSNHVFLEARPPLATSEGAQIALRRDQVEEFLAAE